MPEESAVLFADKYKTPAELEGGIRELHKVLELPTTLPDGTLIGQNTLFPTTDAAVAAYKKLESLHGKVKAPPQGDTKAPIVDAAAPAAKPAALEITAPTPPAGTIDAVLTKAGLKGREAEMADAWQKNGRLSDDHYAAFSKADRGRDEIDTFFRGQAATAEIESQKVNRAEAAAKEVAGGEKQLETLRTWALGNIPKERLAHLNGMIKADPGAYPEVMRVIHAEYMTAVGAGKAEALVKGSPSGGLTGAATAKEFGELRRAAAEGDESAIKRIMATPDDTIRGWLRN